jgi:omega-hydroxy-beta-dihydromenaquinone-9 sulfotransferase
MATGTEHPPRAREWAPRIWQGCDLFAWLRLVLRNSFAVHPRYLYIALIATFISLGNTLLRYLQQTFFGPRVDRTPFPDDPVFIIGHWRTGTTLLHELLILDPRHTYPNYYQCLSPNHFLLTERFAPWLTFLLPSHRPMDNMPVGWDRPQEDEFALCMLGQPSPYLTIAFPNRPPQDLKALDLDSLPPRARDSWKRTFLTFLRQLTFKDPRRLVLKSPTHTCRIRTLLELFPRARFVHIVRNPYVVFPSTVNLWKALYRTHGLQKPTFAGLHEHVFHTFTHLYERLEQTRHLIPPGQFHEVRYEDLVADPLGQMRLLYHALDLGDFDSVRPRLEHYLNDDAGYQTNRYPRLDPALQEEITRRWGEVIRRYGYAPLVRPAPAEPDRPDPARKPSPLPAPVPTMEPWSAPASHGLAP